MIAFIDAAGHPTELLLLQRHGRAPKDAIVSAAQAVGLVFSQHAVLGNLAEYDVDIAGDALGSTDDCLLGNQHRGFSDDVADLVTDQNLHSDAGIPFLLVSQINDGSSDAVRDFVRVSGIYFFKHDVLL